MQQNKLYICTKVQKYNTLFKKYQITKVQNNKSTKV